MTENNTTGKQPILTAQALVNAPQQTVWHYWTSPEHVMQWNQASEEWHTPSAVNDLRDGGSFVYRMEAKDGSIGFDFGGVYTIVTPHSYLEYNLADGRTVTVTFTAKNSATEVVETFEAEATNPLEMQQQGWQAILDQFKKYVEDSNP